jgi:sigma-B regulation protein RsbU (phosphoserine phosphatase)
MVIPPLPRPESSGRFFETYTRGLSTAEVERLITFDTREAYRLFSQHVDDAALKGLPWHRRLLARTRLTFLSFALRLSPARRALYGLALVVTAVGIAELVQQVSLTFVPHPILASGTIWVVAGFLLMNLLVVLEVADRLSLKNDLEVARDIQLAMLPRRAYEAEGVEAFGMTRPANTVGGDFYDVLPRPDGSLLIALGDVAGKGSPAALLMALTLAMMRTLADEGIEGAALMTRLNVQLCKHAPRSRFVTLFIGTYQPATGELVYVNAGHLPPLVRRGEGAYERLTGSGIALGLWDQATYTTGRTFLAPEEVLVVYSDGIVEAEDEGNQPFDEGGLQRVLSSGSWSTVKELGWETFAHVERHVGTRRLRDDLTVLVVRRRRT